MTSELKKPGTDRKLISLREPQEVRTWTASLKCSEGELRGAVGRVGHLEAKVREFLLRRWAP